MPVFEIGLDDGRKLHIDADDQASALAGVQHFLGSSDQQPNTGVVAGLREGIANAARGYGATLGSDQATSAGDAIAPSNYQRPAVVDKDGIHPSAIPQAVAEAAPGFATDLAVARTVGKLNKPLGLAAGAASYLLRNYGLGAKQAAADRTGDNAAEPNTEDKLRSLGTNTAQAAIGTVGLGRLFPSAGGALANGWRGVLQAGQRLATTAGIEGGTGAAANVAGQVGSTIGTPGGVKVDPLQAADAGVTSAATGTMMATPRSVGDALNAGKYSDITPTLQPAAQQFANRVQDAAADRSLKKSDVGYDAVSRAHNDVKSELSDALKDLQTRTTLPTDASNVASAIQKGSTPTDADYDTLTKAIGNDPQAQNVLNLVQQAHVGNLVKDTGTFGNGKFYGGVSPKVASLVTGHAVAKTAIAALAEAEGAHLIAYSPEMLGAVAGAYGLTRATDAITGARSPANRFVNRFADPTAGARVPPPVAPPAPQGPPGPGPTGPQIPMAPQPWQTPPAPPAPGPSDDQLQSTAIKQMSTLGKAMDRVNAMKAAALAAQAPQPEPTAPAPINPLALPKDITGPAKSIMAGARAVNGMASPYAGTQEQMRSATDLLAARRAQAKLAAQQEADAEPDVTAPIEQAKVVTKVSKANGKTKVQTAPAPVEADEPPTVQQGVPSRGIPIPPEPEPAATNGFAFKPQDQLPYYGQEHDEVADAKLPRYTKPSTPKDRAELIRNGIIEGRMADERALEPVMSMVKSNADKVLMVELREDMHHSSSRARAQAARDYVVSHLSDRIAAAKLKGSLSDQVIFNLKHKP